MTRYRDRYAFACKGSGGQSGSSERQVVCGGDIHACATAEIKYPRAGQEYNIVTSVVPGLRLRSVLRARFASREREQGRFDVN